jgi:hypothetical protein
MTAVLSAEYMFPPDSAARPVAHNDWRRLGFWNIGWKLASKMHDVDFLAKEICSFHALKSVDAMGISEVFGMLEEDLHEARLLIMQHLLEELNSSVEPPAWTGQCDAHYIFLWNASKLQLKEHDMVSCGITEHSWRKVQYLQFCIPGTEGGRPLHVYHGHAPSSDKKNFTEARRKRMVSALWAHAMTKACSSAEQPAVVYGGDFNCTPLQWTECFRNMMATQASRRTVQACTSKKKPLHHGDRAIAINVTALQEESGWGKSYADEEKRQSFSDAHDVVLVPLCWDRTNQAATQPAQQKSQQPSLPASSTSCIPMSSSPQPAAATTQAFPRRRAKQPAPTSSAAQPVSSTPSIRVATEPKAATQPAQQKSQQRAPQAPTSSPQPAGAKTQAIPKLPPNSSAAQPVSSTPSILTATEPKSAKAASSGDQEARHAATQLVQQKSQRRSPQAPTSPPPPTSSAEPPASSELSRIHAHLEELQCKTQQGLISDGGVVEALQTLHGTYGNILRLEDFRQPSVLPATTQASAMSLAKQPIPTSSAAQPASSTPFTPNPLHNWDAYVEDPEEQFDGVPGLPCQLELQDVYADSDAHENDEAESMAPSLMLPSLETPLYNDLLKRLSTTGDEEVMERLADFCLYDELRYQRPHGSAEQPANNIGDPYALGLRVEHLLFVTHTQRGNQIARMTARKDARARAPHQLIFSPTEMAEAMNEWRKEPKTWMKPESLQFVNAMDNHQEYHLACKSRFNTMLFQIFGNKALVELFVKFPMCSAEQPAEILNKLADGWESCTTSLKAQHARESSCPSTEPTLSKQIYALTQRLTRGKTVADWIAKDRNRWYQLSRADQSMWCEYNSGDIQERIAALRLQQRS